MWFGLWFALCSSHCVVSYLGRGLVEVELALEDLGGPSSVPLPLDVLLNLHVVHVAERVKQAFSDLN